VSVSLANRGSLFASLAAKLEISTRGGICSARGMVPDHSCFLSLDPSAAQHSPVLRVALLRGVQRRTLSIVIDTLR
jgi:hypothetical protein